jgi:hypothetical protein
MPKPSAEEIAARRAAAAEKKVLKLEQQATVEDTPMFLMVHKTQDYSYEFGEEDTNDGSHFALTLIGTTKELGEGYVSNGAFRRSSSHTACRMLEIPA